MTHTYRLLKDLPYVKAGSIFKKTTYSEDFECNSIDSSSYRYKEKEMLQLPEWFEPVADTPPQIEEIKVPDWIVFGNANANELKIASWMKQITEAVNTLTQKESR